MFRRWQVLLAGSLVVLLPAAGPGAAAEYKTPVNLALSRDGLRLYVVCEASGSLIVVDTDRRVVMAEVEVGNLPHGVCLSPDQRRVYVSNRGSDSVSAVDTRTFAVTATIAVGDEPRGLVTDVVGGRLFVANAGSGDVSVVDLAAGRELRRLPAGRGTWDLSRTPDGRFVYVTNRLSHFVGFRQPSLSEVTVIYAQGAVVVDRILVPGANLVQGIAHAPDGELALVTLVRTKNLVPMTGLIRGWAMTHGIGILWRDGRVDQLLLDEGDNFFADPTAVAMTPDGRYAFVTGAGIDAVAAIDLERMQAVLARATDEERGQVLPNHLGIPSEFVLKRIAVGKNPRGLAVSDDGFVYVADALDDAVSVIDTALRERVAEIDLGGAEEVTDERLGEGIFRSAGATYGGQFSCHSCHPDGGVDGLTYDLEADGIGLNPVDSRTLRGIVDTAPFGWTGKSPSLGHRCGPQLAVFFTRIDPFTPRQIAALERYLLTLPLNPNPHREGDELTQRRGREIFERTHTNGGEVIPVANRCPTCHAPPHFTNRQSFSVGTGSELDSQDLFDVPQLNAVYETAPYLHDGRADALEEIWTRFNPRDEHGVTSDLTEDQLDDLVAYLKSL